MAKKTAKYYQSHPEAREKKNSYQKSYNKRPKEVANRVELNKINRQSQAAGKTKKFDGKDYDHAVKRMIPQSTNRGRAEKSRLPKKR